MSIKTWRKEFMPKMPTKRLTKRQAVEHSLRKWEGLTKKNLKKHGVSKGTYAIWKIFDTENNEVSIDSKSCALCVKYIDDNVNNETHYDDCQKCPLFKTLGHPCDSEKGTPYEAWIRKDNALPMIKALRKTMESLED